MTVRRAMAHDVPAAVAVLVDAFSDYPWTRWTVAEDDHHQRLRALHETYLSAVALPYGYVDVLGEQSRLVAVAAWIDTARVPVDGWRQVGAVASRLAGDRAHAAREAEAVLASHRPAAAHITLATVGVARDQQRRGLGGRVLGMGITRAERDGVPAYLETSDASNVRFYQRLGFTVTAVVEIPDGGPRTWLMSRKPT